VAGDKKAQQQNIKPTSGTSGGRINLETVKGKGKVHGFV